MLSPPSFVFFPFLLLVDQRLNMLSRDAHNQFIVRQQRSLGNPALCQKMIRFVDNLEFPRIAFCGIRMMLLGQSAIGFVDGVKVSEVRLPDLAISGSTFLSVRIGVRPDAEHVGGINLFGSGFGNYPQDIVLRIKYR